MDLLAEIRKLKVNETHVTHLSSQEIENPLPYLERALAEVTGLVRDECLRRNLSYAELLEEIGKTDVGAVERFTRLDDFVDCDVYGRWCNGILTRKELQDFCKAVNDWKVATMEMLRIRRR
jgi:hypothetical protein